MRKSPPFPNPHLPLNIHEQPVVPTTPSKFVRNGGKYESGEALPSLDGLLERTLRAIAHNHESRDRSGRTFDELWNKTCKTLKTRKNAASYDHWKRAAVVKNLRAFQALDQKIGAAWAQIYSSGGEHEPPRQARIEEYESLKQEKETLRTASKVQIDDMLEVAIAYWIEAKNARDARDELRALHALIECWTHIGMTLSPKTEAEANSEAGAKQGKPARDAIAAIANRVLRDMELNRRMVDPFELLGTLVMNIEKDPDHAEALKAYDKQATANRKTDDQLTDRLTAKLTEWATGKRSPYPEFAETYRRALLQAEHLNPATTRRKT